MDDSSPPPETDLPAYATHSSSVTPAPSSHLPPIHSRKRKRAPVASSPAPSDPGSTPGSQSNPELLASRADLSSRPVLTVSRGPLFVQVAENSEYYKTDLIGVNRHGFRYVPAGINPPGHAVPCRTIESNPTSFRVSWEDRSPYLRVTKDGLGIVGNKGFRSARCNAPMREGNWYMEVQIIHGGGEHVSDEARREGSHVRLGWGRREAPLNGPVGLDGYSYGYRDRTGEKVTLSRPRSYGKPFKTGDVVGMYISLPPRRETNKEDPHDPAHIHRERIPIDLKGQEVFEILEYPQSKEMSALMDYSGKSTNSASVPSASKKSIEKGKMPERAGPTNTAKANTLALRPLPALHGSRIAFFLNGECQGTAFQDIYDYLPLRQTETQRKAKEKKRTREGVKEHRENPFDDGTLGYYPFISLFNDACVRLNPGPEFSYPPPPDVDTLLDGLPPPDTKQRTWRPACERYGEFMKEQWALDKLEEEEAKVEAVRLAEIEKVEEEKRLQRQKKRQQADARRKAKKAELAAIAAASATVSPEDDRFGPTITLPGLLNTALSSHPSPSPLRHATAYEPEGSAEYEQHSPAPTYASYGEFQGGQSGYNSESHMEVDQEEGEEGLAEQADTPGGRD
ncbi:hypothetical protein BDQ17DRAFT_1348054 [Cyathus striatus]|nr:hypothetical protein BDQ17DRAFT_1348054 [Cyathus striatus]